MDQEMAWHSRKVLSQRNNRDSCSMFDEIDDFPLANRRWEIGELASVASSFPLMLHILTDSP
jgi:hypothetical protein